jgi:hypothetical protein
MSRCQHALQGDYSRVGRLSLTVDGGRCQRAAGAQRARSASGAGADNPPSGMGKAMLFFGNQIVEFIDQFHEPVVVFFLLDLLDQFVHAFALVRGHAPSVAGKLKF